MHFSFTSSYAILRKFLRLSNFCHKIIFICSFLLLVLVSIFNNEFWDHGVISNSAWPTLFLLGFSERLYKRKDF